MTDECLSDLALLHIDHATEVDIPLSSKNLMQLEVEDLHSLHTPDTA